MDIPFKSKLCPQSCGLRSYGGHCCANYTRTFYADDCLKSAATVPKAIDIVRELCQLLALRGFRLTKWTSNSREVLEAIPAAERAANVKNRELIIIIIIIIIIIYFI